MSFTQEPQEVPLVDTKYRRIITKIPVPESLLILKRLEKYESRSMHGQLPVVWDRAKDFQVFDRWGNRWIDFTSTIFVTNTGHSNSMVIQALRRQLDQPLIHSYTFAHEPRAQFLKKLVEMTPDYLEKAFLLLAGTEATECAVKLMRMYGQANRCSKVGIISFRGCTHGRTGIAEMLKGDPASSTWIGYMDPNIHHLSFPYPWFANQLQEYDWRAYFRKSIQGIEDQGLDFNNMCGFIIESYQGWNALFYPKDYIKELFKFAREYDILVTFDDIQGGFGRTGKLFAYQHYDIEPDLVCLGKSLGGGLPLSAVMGKKEIMDLPETGSMSSTHSANPFCCAAGLANLKELEAKDLIKESARKGKILHSYLNMIKNDYPGYIPAIYGKGLLAAIIIKHEANGELVSRICEKAMQKGLLLVHTGRESIKIGPPLTIPDDALLEGLVVLKEVISETITEVENES